MNPYTIYGLRLIGDKEVRYVGQTRHHLDTRLAGHFGRRRGVTDSPLQVWLHENRPQVECVKLGFADQPDEARAIENVFIALCGRLDHRLFNRKIGRPAANPEGMAA